MKKKGFTLIELLAVIVILAVIALVAVPMILGVINKAKKGSAISSAYGFIDALEKNTVIGELTDDSEKLVVPENGDLLIEDIDMSKVSIKGSKPTVGYITFMNKKIVAAGLCINGYNIDYNGKKATSSESNYCSNISVTVTAGVTTTSSVTISATTNAADIRGYAYKIGDSDWTAETTNAYHTFNSLVIGTTYTVQAKVITTDGTEYTKAKVVTTTDIAAPTYSITPSGWAVSKTLTITYPAQPEGSTYTYSYSIDGGTNWITVTELTKQLTFTAEGSVIARVYDGTNYKTASSYAVSQIEAAPADPSVSLTGGGTIFTTNGFETGDATATITASSGNPYYSLDDGTTWLAYTTPVTGTFTSIKVKSLSEHGISSNIITGNLTASATLCKEAYDGNDTTGCETGVSVLSIPVQTSAVGSIIRVYGSNVYLSFQNASGTELSGIGSSSTKYTSEGKIPTGTTKIVFGWFSSGYGNPYTYEITYEPPSIIAYDMPDDLQAKVNGDFSQVYDGNLDTFANGIDANTILPQVYTFELAKSIKLNNFQLKSIYNVGYDAIGDFKIYGINSLDPTEAGTLIYSGTHTESPYLLTYDVNATQSFKYYKFEIINFSNSNGGNEPAIFELKFNENPPTVSIEGYDMAADIKAVSNTGFTKVFDGNLTTDVRFNLSSVLPQVFTFRMSKSFALKSFQLKSQYYSGYDSVGNFQIYGISSLDPTETGTLIYSGTHTDSAELLTYTVNATQSFKYYKFVVLSHAVGNGGNETTISELKFKE